MYMNILIFNYFMSIHIHSNHKYMNYISIINLIHTIEKARLRFELETTREFATRAEIEAAINSLTAEDKNLAHQVRT
jgi:hypothetical protein